MKVKNLTYTVGIPTYYGAHGLVKTVKSIKSSKGVDDFEIIVTVDGNPLSDKVKNALLNQGVKLIENKKRGGQVERIKQLIKLVKNDILILTQDDVLFEKNTLHKIVKHFESNPKTTMVGARIFPMKANTFFEQIVEIGVFLTHCIGDMWNHGDNYLLSSGRCLAFRLDFVKSFEIPVEVINSDAYLYFENKRKGGSFVGLKDAIVYNKSPQNPTENNKQSKKFLASQAENEKYMKHDLTDEYSIPLYVKLRCLVSMFVQKPIIFSLYVFLILQTRFIGKNIYVHKSRFWDTDTSTKTI